MADELNNTQGTETESQGQEVKTYTQEEVDAMIQSAADKRVASALKKAEKKNQDKIREAEKLANMNAQEKYEYELQQREAAIAEKERELLMAENKNEASKILADKGLSLALVDFVVAEDADEMNTRIRLLDTEFKKSVKAEVEKRLGSKTPEKSEIDTSAITKEQFKNIKDATVLMKIKKEQPELWAQLTER